MLCTSLSADDLGKSAELQRNRPNCQRTKCREHARQKIRASKRLELQTLAPEEQWIDALKAWRTKTKHCDTAKTIIVTQHRFLEVPKRHPPKGHPQDFLKFQIAVVINAVGRRNTDERKRARMSANANPQRAHKRVQKSAST